MKVSLHTLGCKVNQYETQAIAEELIKNGFELTQDDAAADVFVVNSCTVTAESDRKTRQLVRRLKQLRPESVLVLTGCMPQAYPEAARSLLQADVVLGNRTNAELPCKLKEFIAGGERIFDVRPHGREEPFCGAPISDFRGRTRAVLKIEDGCERFCSYCIIPTARGPVRSRPAAEIRTEAAALAAAGFCELVLVGINLTCYGLDTGRTLCEAVRAAAEPEGVRRVRLGSLEPDGLTDEVIMGLSRLEKLCPQFHISLQSGCDRTLKRMGRHCTAEEFYALCGKLRGLFPGCALTTDVMAGFPGETEEDFAESLRFVQKVGFAKVHVFPFSPRPGTRAAAMDGQVTRRVRENRAAGLRREAEKLRRAFLAGQVGREAEILVESETKDGLRFGYTANYTPVLAGLPESCVGRLVRVKLTGSDGNYCRAE